MHPIISKKLNDVGPLSTLETLEHIVKWDDFTVEERVDFGAKGQIDFYRQLAANLAESLEADTVASTFKVPEEYRITTGMFGSDVTCGNNGAFLINDLYCLASDGMDWEHVSVSVQDGHRLPTHYDMERIKSLFWGDESYVIEIHPPKSEYVNNAPVLHLWRPTKEKLPVPPSVLVGLK